MSSKPDKVVQYYFDGDRIEEAEQKADEAIFCFYSGHKTVL